MTARSLRKGYESTYLQYANGGESMGAEKYEAEIVENAVVLRFTLRPVDSNQKSDEEHLHTQPLVSIQIMDELIIEKFDRFCAARAKGIPNRKLEIISRGKTLGFDIKRAVRRSDSFLELELQKLDWSVST
jgi:hypothetical protein